MNKLIFIIFIIAFTGCEISDKPSNYKEPTIDTQADSPALPVIKDKTKVPPAIPNI